VVNGLVLEDSEARQLSGERDLLRAGRWVCKHGVAYCIIEKGEDGSILHGPDGVFVLPASPTEQVKDPKGAGDAFAGGLMGYREGSVTAQALRRALAYGTAMASFAIEDSSLEGLKAATTET